MVGKNLIKDECKNDLFYDRFLSLSRIIMLFIIDHSWVLCTSRYRQY